MQPQRISSKSNPLVQRARRLSRTPMAYREDGLVWLEGEHLCAALLERGLKPAFALMAESAWGTQGDGRLAALARAAHDLAVLPDRLFADLSPLPSPGGIAFLQALPAPPAIEPRVATIVLDRVQDAGNVGSILRSAAALGFRQVLSLKGSAGLWSPKVLRAGMGAQWGMSLREDLALPDLEALALSLVATSSHAPLALPAAPLPEPCAWVFGHEGQGVADDLLAHCELTVRIPQPGGEESLNVAAAAAVCLYESMRRRA